jgi:hypothetical protein
MQDFSPQEPPSMIDPHVVSREEFERRMGDMTGFINTTINNASGRIIVQVEQQIAATEQKILQMVDQRFRQHEQILMRHEQILTDHTQQLAEIKVELADLKRMVQAIAQALNIQGI